MVQQPNFGRGHLVVELSRSHTVTHSHSINSPGRVISLSQRPVPSVIHNTHKIQTFMPPSGFEGVIAANERPHTHTLDRAATRSCSVTFLRRFTCRAE